jgi:hypothetical protein
LAARAGEDGRERGEADDRRRVPDGGPFRLMYFGQDKQPALPPSPRNVFVPADGSLTLA